MARKDCCTMILNQNNDMEVIICTEYFQYSPQLVKFYDYSHWLQQGFASRWQVLGTKSILLCKSIQPICND